MQPVSHSLSNYTNFYDLQSSIDKNDTSQTDEQEIPFNEDTHLDNQCKEHGSLTLPEGSKCRENFSNDDVYNNWPAKKTIKYVNGDVYEGDLNDASPHGEGIYTFANGNTYDGTWLNGKWHGYGIAKFASGQIYTGEWKDNKRHGTGIFQWPDGSIYTGIWLNDKRHGKGKLTCEDGEFYEGEWKHNKRHGYGVEQYQGEIYKGNWSHDKMVGEGLLILNNEHVAYKTIDGEPLAYEMSEGNSQEVIHYYLGG